MDERDYETLIRLFRCRKCVLPAERRAMARLLLRMAALEQVEKDAEALLDAMTEEALC